MVRKYYAIIMILFFTCIFIGTANAAISQYAGYVIGFSEEYDQEPRTASSLDALDAPDTTIYDGGFTNYNAWCAHNQATKDSYGNPSGSSQYQYLTLRFATPVYATGASIWEAAGIGFVYGIDLVDTDGVYHSIGTVTDPLTGQASRDSILSLNWDPTDYLVKGIKIYVDIDKNQDEWEMIDAVELRGSSPVPLPPGFLLLAPGLAGLIAVRKRFIN